MRIATKETAVCFLELSQQKNHLIIGRDDGGLSLINLSAIHETRALNIQSHGGCTRLTGACLTHDNSFVLTAGADGLIVVSQRMHQAAPCQVTVILATQVKETLQLQNSGTPILYVRLQVIPC